MPRTWHGIFPVSSCQPWLLESSGLTVRALGLQQQESSVELLLQLCDQGVGMLSPHRHSSELRVSSQLTVLQPG